MEEPRRGEIGDRQIGDRRREGVAGDGGIKWCVMRDDKVREKNRAVDQRKKSSRKKTPHAFFSGSHLCRLVEVVVVVQKQQNDTTRLLVHG